MQVCFDHQIFSLQEYGGISRYFQELVHQLSGRPGYDVSVVCPLYINRHLRNDSKVPVKGVFLAKPPKLGRAVHAVNRFLTPAILGAMHPQIVHETYYSSARVAPARSKTVLTVFDMIHEKQKAHFLEGDRTTEAKRSAVARADHVICISESTRRDLLELFQVDPAKTSVVYLAHSIDESLLKAKSRLVKEPYILHVGVRQGYKNFRKLLEAYGSSERLKRDFSLVCIGAGPLDEGEKSLARSLGIPENSLRWMKGGDYELANLYGHASLFVYPSLYEGFGIPPLEAMAMGCPVACGSVSSLSEVVGDAAETFDPNSAEEIARAMTHVLYSMERSAELVNAGTRRLERFSWKKCADDTCKIYEAL